MDTTDTSLQNFNDDAYDTPNVKEIKTRLRIRQRTIPNYGTGVQATALRLADLQRRVAQSSYENRREKELKEREEVRHDMMVKSNLFIGQFFFLTHKKPYP